MSSTLWATASKEWTIAPKPKPGRKPKSDSSSLKDSNDINLISDVHYRAAQRAFRERKQSQLTELQARVQSYEQGQVERNVALQTVAKRLKEENEALRRENQLLKEKMARMEEGELVHKKNTRERSPDPSNPTLSTKRTKLSASTSIIPPQTITHTSFPIEATQPIYPAAPAIGYIHAKEGLGNSDRNTTFDCGFCNDVVPCLCRAIAEEELETSNSKLSDFQPPESVADISVHPVPGTSNGRSTDRTSILDNLPAFQPAVPLPRKRSTTKTVFPLVSPRSRTVIDKMCTGDPSDCPACADDAFGKAFCTAIGDTVASQSSCIDCPGSQRGPATHGPQCCGNPERCGSRLSIDSSSISQETTIPTSEAWKRIKAHPNVSFADLSLLAEVVARRSKCTGPTVVISPALGEATPERVNSPEVDSRHFSNPERLLSDNTLSSNSVSAHITARDFMLRCGRRKVREVYAEDVQNALHLLDTKYP